MKAAKYIGSAAASVFGYFYLKDSRSAIHSSVFMPLNHLIDAETSHQLAIWLCKHGFSPRETHAPTSDALKVKIWDTLLNSPIGLAAGFDKNADAVDSMFNLGFDIVEVGSVTPNPQPGNPKPRMFRLPSDEAVINRYGFNSQGADAVALKLENRRNSPWFSKKGLLGVNLGKNKTSAADSNQDYVDGALKLGKYADYLVVNVSSPNTPGLRSLQKKQSIQQLLGQVKDARDTLSHKPPLLVKIAPDLSDSELADIAESVTAVGIDGVIISNTTISRPLQSTDKTRLENGGLSGKPVKPLALKMVSKFYKLTNGKIPIIGCGGISSAQDAIEFCKAGATCVQLYTALGYQGPGLVTQIKHDLVDLLEKEAKTWQELVGSMK